ncbi:hypothetical protein AB832_02275 [Flavobacteriaceae bacterium (ex Bugula neritina AB1)]|nr:hypothetical protein AB832_02275 [Flavobacteriaceae bacterium (ex Bugula neritina AB1)]
MTGTANYPSPYFVGIHKVNDSETALKNASYPYVYLTFKGDLSEFESLLKAWNEAEINGDLAPITYEVRENNVISLDLRYCKDAYQAAFEFSTEFTLKFKPQTTL